MIAVRKHLVLVGQIGAAAVHQIDAGQPVLQRDLLRAQVFFHRDRIVGAAFHRCVVGNDDALAPGYAADARYDPGGRDLAAVHAVRGELTDFQERRGRIDQRPDTVSRQQFSARQMPLTRRLATALTHPVHRRAEVRYQRRHRVRIGAEFLGTRINYGLDDRHMRYAVSLNSSRPISMRRISLVPAPISYSLASRNNRPVG